MLEWICRVVGLLAVVLVRMKMGKADEMGHFQVHNEQEGDLKIHATKEIAQVNSLKFKIVQKMRKNGNKVLYA